MDDKTAATAGYALGDAVSLITSGAEPSVTGTPVGTVRFGPSGNLVGAMLVLMDTTTAQQIYVGGADVFGQVAVTGDGSLSNQQLRDSVIASLPAGFEAVDDQQIAAENENQLEQTLSLFTTLPAGVRRGLAVRRHLPDPEHLLDRRHPTNQGTGVVPGAWCLPAPGHPLRPPRGAGIGLIGSTVGLLLGFGLAQGLKSHFGGIGIDLTQAGLVFQWRTAAAAYAVGVLVTLFAAYLPARRAARVPPIAAMRDDVTIPESSLSRRTIGGTLLTAAAFMLWALAFDGGLALLGAGVLAVFIGVARLSPTIGRPIVSTIAAPFPGSSAPSECWPGKTHGATHGAPRQQPPR